MSMAAKLSVLGDRTSLANLQTEGHAGIPSQSAEDQQESEASDSSHSFLPSLSLARRPPSGHPNTKYCLKIHVTLTEELGAMSPLSHSWMAPLAEDMLCDARTSLTKAVVIGPGRAVLFMEDIQGGGSNHRRGQGCHIATHWSRYVGWETSLPHCQSNDHSRRLMGDCPSYNRLPSKG